MPTSSEIIVLPQDFLGNVFYVTKSFLSGGLWVLVAIALGVLFAFLVSGKVITWVKRAVSGRGRRR